MDYNTPLMDYYINGLMDYNTLLLYPLVSKQFAIEHDHRNTGFSH